MLSFREDWCLSCCKPGVLLFWYLQCLCSLRVSSKFGLLMQDLSGQLCFTSLYSSCLQYTISWSGFSSLFSFLPWRFSLLSSEYRDALKIIFIVIYPGRVTMPFDCIWFVVLPEVEVPGGIIHHRFTEEETRHNDDKYLTQYHRAGEWSRHWTHVAYLQSLHFFF